MTSHLSPDAVLHVRPARPADAERVAELSRQLGYEATAGQMHSRLQHLEHDPGRAVLVACTPDGTVIGWIDVYITFHLQSGASAEIGGLVVGEGTRSQGVGSLLVAQAEAWATSKGMTHIRVRSNIKRSDAHRFYERENYVRSKTSAVFDKEL